jgi:hypothetical protein
MKIYQVKYTYYGTQKYCYTDNFIDFYASYTEVKPKLNRLLFHKEFYDKIKEYDTKRKSI